MEEISRVPFEVSGLLDGVEANVNSSIATFKCNEDGEPIELVGVPNTHRCRILASCSDGMVSISVRDIGIMVSVRIDELSAVIREAVVTASECLDSCKKESEEFYGKEDGATKR